jgi:hypothetical protein
MIEPTGIHDPTEGVFRAAAFSGTQGAHAKARPFHRLYLHSAMSYSRDIIDHRAPNTACANYSMTPQPLVSIRPVAYSRSCANR